MLLAYVASACLCPPAPTAAAPAAKGRHGEPPPAAAPGVVPPPSEKSGCIVLDIHVGPPTGLTVKPVPGAACGPVQPTIAGRATEDAATRTIRLPVALVNGGITQLHAPAAVVAKPGSLQVPGRPVGVGGPHYVASDTAAGDQAPTPAGAGRWSYDGNLQPPDTAATLASDGEVVLPPGMTSAPRTIAISVPPGVTGFRVTLAATGTTVLTVPAQPPERVPPDELEDSWSSANVLSGDPRIGGRVVRNKLWLLFRPQATTEQRQAAIDAVQGIVVGGKTIGADHYYYVRFPAYPDSGGAPLARALRTLAPLPQVQHVMPDAFLPSATAR